MLEEILNLNPQLYISYINFKNITQACDVSNIQYDIDV